MKTEQEVKEAFKLINASINVGTLSRNHAAMATHIYACLAWVLDIPGHQGFDLLISGIKEGLAEIRERN